jgi:hypothetical protein
LLTLDLKDRDRILLLLESGGKAELHPLKRRFFAIQMWLSKSAVTFIDFRGVLAQRERAPAGRFPVPAGALATETNERFR